LGIGLSIGDCNCRLALGLLIAAWLSIADGDKCQWRLSICDMNPILRIANARSSIANPSHQSSIVNSNRQSSIQIGNPQSKSAIANRQFNLQSSIGQSSM